MRPAPAAAWRPSRHLTPPNAASRHLTSPHIAYIAFRRFTSPYCSSPHGTSHRNASQRITSLQSTPPDSSRTAPYQLTPHSSAAAHIAASDARSGRMVPLPVLRTVSGRCTLLQTCCQSLLFTGALSALPILALSSKAAPLLIYMQQLPRSLPGACP